MTIEWENGALGGTIVARSDIDAENKCQSIIKATKNMENIEFIGER